MSSMRVSLKWNWSWGFGLLIAVPASVIDTFVGRNSRPDWSTNGKYLAYVSVRQVASPVIGIRTLATGQVRELSISPASFGKSDTFSWAPNGGSFIVTGRDLKQVPGIYRIDAQTGQSSLMVSGQGKGGQPVLSPDGKTLYYGQWFDLPGGNEFAFVKRDLASGSETELIRRPALGVVNLSPDGRYIATSSGDPSTKSNTFLIIPTVGGEPTEVIRRAQPQHPFMFVWGLDSRSLLIRIGSDDQKGGDKFELWRAFVDGTQPVKLDAMVDRNIGTARLHPDGRQIAFEVTTPRKPMEIWVTENFLPPTPSRKAAVSRR